MLRDRIRDGGAVAVGLLLLCSGCATTGLKAPRPEVTIAASIADVKAAIEGDLLNRGFLIMRTEGATIIGDKQMGLGAQLLIGDPAHRPAERIRYNVVELPGDVGLVRVAAFPFITHAYFADETEADNPRINAGLQYSLDCIKADLERTPRPAPPVLPDIKAQSPRAAAR